MILDFKEYVASNLGDFHSQVLTHESGQIARSMMRWAQTMIPYGVINNQGNLLTYGQSGGEVNILVPLRRDLVETVGPDAQERIRVRYGDADGSTYTLIRRNPIPNFDLGHVVPGLGADVDDNTSLILGDRCSYMLWDIPTSNTRASEELLHTTTVYLTPIPMGLHPRSIQGCSRTLLEGIDFVVGHGVITTRDHPDLLFGNKTWFCCRAGDKAEAHLFDYQFAVGGNQRVTDIAAMYKGRYSASILERAIASVAGLSVTEEPATLISATRLCVGYDYAFTTGNVRAPYEHDPLPSGVAYPSGTIIGNEMVKVKRHVPGSSSWYRDGVDWGSGLSLDGFCAVSGLTAPDQYVRLESLDGYTTGGLVHTKLWLHWSDEARTKYWGLCKAAEIRTGKTLAEALGMSEGDVTHVNPLDLLFGLGGLGRSALLVVLKMDNLPEIARDRVVSFLRREKPTASTLIIR